jgi:rhodanese-related sulfurtransferase
MKKQNTFTSLIVALAFSLTLCATSAVAATYGKNLVAQAKKQVKTLDLSTARGKLGQTDWVILDVRTEKEYKRGHLPGAVNIPRGKLEFSTQEKLPNNKANILVYCKKGGRAVLATKTLQDMGYKNAVSMFPGFTDWLKAGNPVD